MIDKRKYAKIAFSSQNNMFMYGFIYNLITLIDLTYLGDHVMSENKSNYKKHYTWAVKETVKKYNDMDIHIKMNNGNFYNRLYDIFFSLYYSTPKNKNILKEVLNKITHLNNNASSDNQMEEGNYYLSEFNKCVKY